MKKKCLRLFNKNNTFLCWTKLKAEKLLATAKQLIRKNSICCLKNQANFFHRVNVQIGLAPSPLFVFRSLFKDPPSTTNVPFE